MENEILFQTLSKTNQSLHEIATLLYRNAPGRELTEEEKQRIREELAFREGVLLELRNTRVPPSAAERPISGVLDARRAIVFRP